MKRLFYILNISKYTNAFTKSGCQYQLLIISADLVLYVQEVEPILYSNLQNEMDKYFSDRQYHQRDFLKPGLKLGSCKYC